MLVIKVRRLYKKKGFHLFKVNVLLLSTNKRKQRFVFRTKKEREKYSKICHDCGKRRLRNTKILYTEFPHCLSCELVFTI